jgi:hypothetical protein
MVITSSGRDQPGPGTADGLGPGGVRPCRPPPRSAPRREPTGRPTVFSLGLAVGLHGLLLAAWTVVPVHRPANRVRPQPPVEAVTYLSVQDWIASAHPGAQPSPLAAGIGPAPGAPAAHRAAATPDPLASGVGISGADTVAARAPGDAPPGAAENPRRSSPPGPEFRDVRLIVPRHRQGTRTPAPAEYLEEFRKRLVAFTDSLPFDEGRERRLREWTWTDGAGRAWGVREGVIVVNGTSIAAEHYPDRDRQVSQRMQGQRSRESQRQGEDAERERHLAGRNRAITDRRSAPRQGNGGAGRAPPP